MADTPRYNQQFPRVATKQGRAIRKDASRVEGIVDELLAFVGEEFEKLLQTKTSWGRNEVMSLFYKAWVLGLSRYARKKGVDLT